MLPTLIHELGEEGYRIRVSVRGMLINNSDPTSGFLVYGMPTCDGKVRAWGIGFYYEGQRYIVLKNFHITNCAYELFAGGTDQNYEFF